MAIILLLTLLAVCQNDASSLDYYTAAVVEYATPAYPNYTADEVMLANAATYVAYMANASLSKVDIIVFPEGGLFGHNNARKSISLPSPTERSNPCEEVSRFHAALVLLSCAAKQFQMYLVINTGEEYYNSITNKTEFYNSNLAFDRSGTVIARYRKFNPYGEPVTKPPLDLHTFDTDFGVTFGMFTCFDIAFEEPGVVLARDFGVKHFIFPHCWISELPFLTAIQAQFGFAYSLDTVLLASGCNQPSQGGSGSGIYHGRRGAQQYVQTNQHTSRLIVANVSKSFDPQNRGVPSPPLVDTTVYRESSRNVLSQDYSDLEMQPLDDVQTYSSLTLLRDYTDVYRSRLLFPTTYTPYTGNDPPPQNSSLAVTLTTETTLCQDSLCCDFQVKVTSTFNATPPSAPPRGDDFTRQFYRLVAFDGVRWYGGGLATGGVQVCGVISCVNESLSSCGLRADAPSAQAAVYGRLYKAGTVFESVTVTGTFRYNRTFLYPDILTTGSGDGFAALLSPDLFTYETFGLHNGSVIASLTIDTPLPNLVTAAIYARLFDRDGEKRTELTAGSSAHPQSIFMFCVLLLIFFNCIFSWIS